MRAIILSAGQGSRLMPWTALQPKCLLEVDDGETLLGLQLRALAASGVTHASVVVGFAAERVENVLRGRPLPGMHVETLHNPFFAVADNLVSCWMARERMRQPFLLLNGDTLFEPAVLQRLMASEPAPVALAIDRKQAYDDDDMKVCVEGSRLRAVGKSLDPRIVNGESIGMLVFRGQGPRLYRRELDAALHAKNGLRAWHLAVIDRLARREHVETVCVSGLKWREIDVPEDLAAARAEFGRVPRAA